MPACFCPGVPLSVPVKVKSFFLKTTLLRTSLILIPLGKSIHRCNFWVISTGREIRGRKYLLNLHLRLFCKNATSVEILCRPEFGPYSV